MLDIFVGHVTCSPDPSTNFEITNLHLLFDQLEQVLEDLLATKATKPAIMVEIFHARRCPSYLNIGTHMCRCALVNANMDVHV